MIQIFPNTDQLYQIFILVALSTEYIYIYPHSYRLRRSSSAASRSRSTSSDARTSPRTATSASASRSTSIWASSEYFVYYTYLHVSIVFRVLVSTDWSLIDLCRCWTRSVAGSDLLPPWHAEQARVIVPVRRLRTWLGLHSCNIPHHLICYPFVIAFPLPGMTPALVSTAWTSTWWWAGPAWMSVTGAVRLVTWASSTGWPRRMPWSGSRQSMMVSSSTKKRNKFVILNETVEIKDKTQFC